MKRRIFGLFRRRILLLARLILPAATLSVAFAQAPALDPIGVVTGHAAALLGGVAAMGAWSAGITGWLRHHILTKLQGTAVTLLAIAIAFASTEGLNLWLHAAWTIVAVLAFSLAAGIWAGGTLATLKGPLKPIFDLIYSFAVHYLPKGVTAPDAPPDAGAPQAAANAAAGGGSGNSPAPTP